MSVINLMVYLHSQLLCSILPVESYMFQSFMQFMVYLII